MKLARRQRQITAFQVMELLAQARAMEANGVSVVHMEIGEPDFASAEPIARAGQQALTDGRSFYTPALGLMALREALAEDYAHRFQVEVSPQRIIITPGASGALLLAMSLLAEPDAAVMLADPGYPCNRNFVHLFDGEVQAVAVDARSDFQLTAQHVDTHWRDNTRAVLLASPSNPTGTLIEQDEMARIAALVQRRGGVLIVDEIYQNLVYERAPQSVLSVDDSAWVVNSFSKYFGMTGWRLGWLVLPETQVPAADRVAQNVFLAAPTIAQHAALAALADNTQPELERRRREFQRRRDWLLPALESLGFKIPARPQGAFYLYADCSRFTTNSFAFARKILNEAHVAVTPGADFGQHQAGRYLRFACTTSLEQLQSGVERLSKFLRS